MRLINTRALDLERRRHDRPAREHIHLEGLVGHERYTTALIRPFVPDRVPRFCVGGRAEALRNQVAGGAAAVRERDNGGVERLMVAVERGRVACGMGCGFGVREGGGVSVGWGVGRGG